MRRRTTTPSTSKIPAATAWRSVTGNANRFRRPSVAPGSFHWNIVCLKRSVPMSEHKITLEWKRESENFTYESSNRDHEWVFEGGARVSASAAPAYRGNPALVNPEEALVAALS